MITWDDAQLDFVQTTKDTSADSLSFFKRRANYWYKYVLNSFERSETEKTVTTTTVANQHLYQLQVSALWIKSVTVTIGTRVYTPVEVDSQDEWNRLTSYPRTSDMAERFFVKKRFGLGGQVVDLWPTPSSSGNTITVVYEPTDRDMQYDAYTTGTITVTGASATVTGSGTIFTTSMVNRYLKTSDGFFYRIAQFGSSTSLTLENVYQGVTEAGATYGVYDLFNLPEDTQMLPVYGGLRDYYAIKQNQGEELKYRGYFKENFDDAKARYGTKSRSNTTHDLRTNQQWPGGSYPGYFPAEITPTVSP